MSNHFLANTRDSEYTISQIRDELLRSNPQYDGVGFKVGGGIVKNGKRYQAISVNGKKNAVYLTRSTAVPYPNSFAGASTFQIYFPSAATQLSIASSSALDDSSISPTTNASARVLTVVGLDASYNQIIEQVPLLGQTPVTTVNSFYRLQTMIVSVSGTSESIQSGINAGTISAIPLGQTFTAGVPDNPAQVMIVMSPNLGFITPSYFTSPPGSDLYFSELVISSATIQKDVFFKIEFLLRDSASLAGWKVLTTLNTSSSQPIISLHQGGFPSIDFTGGTLGNDLQIAVSRSTAAAATDTDFSINVYLTGILVTDA